MPKFQKYENFKDVADIVRHILENFKNKKTLRPYQNIFLFLKVSRICRTIFSVPCHTEDASKINAKHVGFLVFFNLPNMVEQKRLNC